MKQRSLKGLGYAAGCDIAGFVNCTAFTHTGRLPYALAASVFAIAGICLTLKWIKEGFHDGNNTRRA